MSHVCLPLFAERTNSTLRGSKSELNQIKHRALCAAARCTAPEQAKHPSTQALQGTFALSSPPKYLGNNDSYTVYSNARPELPGQGCPFPRLPTVFSSSAVKCRGGKIGPCRAADDAFLGHPDSLDWLKGLYRGLILAVSHLTVYCIPSTQARWN